MVPFTDIDTSAPLANAFDTVGMHWISALISLGAVTGLTSVMMVELVTIGDPRYPQVLREIFDPPIVLFTRGRVELLKSLGLGVVGTRRPTPYGIAVAERLSADLAHAGLTIVSGMARGIDTSAHKGALGAGGEMLAPLVDFSGIQ